MNTSESLQVSTPTERDIVITRVFDAPRHLVFEALTNPELLKQWLTGLPGWTLAVCEVDLKPGGAYRYVWRDPDGNEMGMGGIMREVVPPERIVASEQFDEPWYPGEGLVTQTLVERGGKTTLTIALRYGSQEARDIALESGIDGMGMSYDRLAELLASTLAREEK
jgi:uncharacterized protein YndB with AHSA1/START domain